MQHKARDDAERQRDRPEEDVVHEHQHFRVAAASQHALGHDAVGGLENEDDTDGGHQLERNVLRRIRDVVAVDDRVLNESDDQRRDNA